jgi:hypothetical protein
MHVTGDTAISSGEVRCCIVAKILAEISSKSRFSMISLSSSILSFILSIVAKLTGKFTSLEEPTDDSDIAIGAVLLADRSDFIGSERRIDPKELT